MAATCSDGAAALKVAAICDRMNLPGDILLRLPLIGVIPVYRSIGNYTRFSRLQPNFE